MEKELFSQDLEAKEKAFIAAFTGTATVLGKPKVLGAGTYGDRIPVHHRSALLYLTPAAASIPAGQDMAETRLCV